MFELLLLVLLLLLSLLLLLIILLLVYFKLTNLQTILHQNIKYKIAKQRG